MDHSQQPRRRIRPQARSVDGFAIHQKKIPSVVPPQGARLRQTLTQHPGNQPRLETMSRPPEKPQTLPANQPRSMLHMTLPTNLTQPQAPPAAKKHRKKRSKKKIALLIFIFLVLAGIGAGGWDVWQLDHKVN